MIFSEQPRNAKLPLPGAVSALGEGGASAFRADKPKRGSQGEYLQLLLIGLPILIVLVAALADLGMGPNLVGGRLPVGGIGLALLAQMIHAFRAL